MQGAGKHRGLARPAQKFGQDGQRGGIRLVAGVAFRGKVGAHQVGFRHAFILQRKPAFGQLRRFLRAFARHYVVAGLQRAVMLFGQGTHGVGCHVAGHDEGRVVGRVIPLVVRQRIVAVEFGHLVPPADDRHRIGMVKVLRGAHLFGKQGAGVAVGSLGAFFKDHLTFGGNVLVRQTQVAHPVGFHLHHQIKPVGGDALEVGGVIPRGEGIVVAALRLDQGGKAAGFDLVGALEHQVFKEVRNARMPRRFVSGPNPVPDHVHNHRRAVIFDHDDIEAVLKLEVGHSLGVGGKGDAKGNSGQKAGSSVHG